MSGLRNFSDNASAGEFTVVNRYHFTAAGDFTNAGTVQVVFLGDIPFETTIVPEFTIPAGHTYTQTAGKTLLVGKFSGGQMIIAGGELSGRGAIQSGVTIGDARFFPE